MPQHVLIKPPVQSTEPVLFIFGCLLGYGPQEGWPVLARLSYGTGCLCRLRCSVGPFSSVGPDFSGLPLDTMSQSDT